MGARRTLALINRKSYVDLVQGGRIDIAISPAHTSIGSCWPASAAATWPPCTAHRGAAEALELVAHGDARHCKVIGRRLRGPADRHHRRPGPQDRHEPHRIPRPGAYEVPIVEVIMAHHDTVIRPTTT